MKRSRCGTIKVVVTVVAGLTLLAGCGAGDSRAYSGSRRDQTLDQALIEMGLTLPACAAEAARFLAIDSIEDELYLRLDGSAACITDFEDANHLVPTEELPGDVLHMDKRKTKRLHWNIQPDTIYSQSTTRLPGYVEVRLAVDHTSATARTAYVYVWQYG